LKLLSHETDILYERGELYHELDQLDACWKISEGIGPVINLVSTLFWMLPPKYLINNELKEHEYNQFQSRMVNCNECRYYRRSNPTNALYIENLPPIDLFHHYANIKHYNIQK